MELRIYYECLEQAYDYVYQIIKNLVSNIDVKLVRKPRIRVRRKTALTAIYSLTTPDFMITLCKDDIEVPILTGEFSEAVATEDHELQRAIVGIAAYLSDIIHLKISGEKKSPRAHGGKVVEKLPLIIAKAFREAFNYDGYIIAEWPTVPSNPYVLQRDKERLCLSCPPMRTLKLAKCVIRKAVASSIENFDEITSGAKDVVKVVMESLASEDIFQGFEEALDEVDGVDYFKREWQKRTKYAGRKARVFVSGNQVVVKINRFSHAADPDRGVLIFASMLSEKISNKPTIYARYTVNGSPKTPQELFKMFISQASEEGIPDEFLKKLKQYCGKVSNYGAIDITQLWTNSRNIWMRNKVLTALSVFSDGLIIHAKNMEWRDRNQSLWMIWDRQNIVLGRHKNLEQALREMYGFKKYGKPLVLLEASSITEDEVTYVVVHKILRLNNFELVSVSFPGAQGDAAILPKEKTGRKRPRIYVDIIAWLPPEDSQPSSELLLEENKKSPQRRELDNAVKRLRKLREQPDHLEALKDTLCRLGYKNRTISKIYIGVGFGVGQRTRTTWNPAEVDFIVKIINRTRWKIAAFEEGLRRAFKEWEGSTSLPKVWVAVDDPSETLLRYV